MDAAYRVDNEQKTLWNGLAGHAWVEMQEALDRMFKPIEDLLVAAAADESANRVLDVGCGAGATTLAVARRLGGDGRCVGIDISDPLIATAQARAAREGVPARFILGDAESHDFEPAGFDLIVSRFGVMFFGDTVRAFANLRHAARGDAGLRCVVWRSAAENPFMTTAERAAAPLLPDMPTARPGAPGQFALADGNRLQDIVERSGWTEIDIQPFDAACTLPEAELVRYFTRLGPLGRILHEAEDRTRRRIVETVRAAFEPYVTGPEVRFDIACWVISARAPSARVVT